jgi:beta-galactosidase
LIDHWNLSVLPEETVEAWVFANGPSVELFLNEQPMGSRVMSECENRIASFYLPYRPGTLTAVTRDRDGTELARSRIQTAGEPAAVEIALDRGEMRADGQDLCHAVISIVDENGVRVPTAEDVVGVEVLGAARLIGMDNGDLTCREPYDASERSARSGRCLAVIRAGHMAGEVVVRGIVAGLPAAVGKVRLV